MRTGVVKLVLTGFFLAASLVGTAVEAKSLAFNGTEATVPLGELPPQGYAAYQRIRQGGPFAFEKDGVVFGNRERLLPARKRGYYHEYTVKTPGSGNRGVRRIVCGGPVTAPDACYYTADHYASFRKILP